LARGHPASQAGAAAATECGERVENRAVADKIEYGAKLLAFGDMGAKVWPLDLDPLDS
jgi:hypothetical protein